MRTTARLLTGTALAAAATFGFGTQASYAGDAGDAGNGGNAGKVEALEVYPTAAPPGTTITVNTTACGPGGHGVGDAHSLGAGKFNLVPGTHKEVVVGQFTIPRHTKPGVHGISVRCANGKRAAGDLVVRHHKHPSGHVDTGVGGSVGPDTTQIAAGVAVLAVSAVGGTLLLRRRASGAQDS